MLRDLDVVPFTALTLPPTDTICYYYSGAATPVALETRDGLFC